jgi:hypothetical protein
MRDEIAAGRSLIACEVTNQILKLATFPLTIVFSALNAFRLTRVILLCF